MLDGSGDVWRKYGWIGHLNANLNITTPSWPVLKEVSGTTRKSQTCASNMGVRKAVA